MVTKEQVAKSEQQIYGLRKSVRYDIRELTVQIIVNKYEKGLDYQEDDEFLDKSKFYNVLFIPDYQRDFTWDTVRQSRFIESILLGLPIPLVFVAENKDSAWEIVDGSQRIRTLHAFLNNKLTLNSLEKIDALNGFQFKDLDVSRQGKFMDTPLRMIVLSEDADDEVKRDMFERINRGSDLLKPIQMRRNIRGKFTDFIFGITERDENEIETEWKEVNILLKELTPVDNWSEKRDERTELVLRFFALVDIYGKELPKKDVQKFLDNYLEEKNKEVEQNPDLIKGYYAQILEVLKFVKSNTTFGFRENNRKKTKRVIFEALSVGVHFALLEKPDLVCQENQILSILTSKELRETWSGNSQVVYALNKVFKRIEIIKNQLLGK
jgi:uncharacterized protein with ParB-like and HNH nuclease domain